LETDLVYKVDWRLKSNRWKPVDPELSQSRNKAEVLSRRSFTYEQHKQNVSITTMREKGARVANEIDETKTKNEQKKLNNLVCQDFFHNM